jgi:hypothetical protein
MHDFSISSPIHRIQQKNREIFRDIGIFFENNEKSTDFRLD